MLSNSCLKNNEEAVHAVTSWLSKIAPGLANHTEEFNQVKGVHTTFLALQAAHISALTLMRLRAGYAAMILRTQSEAVEAEGYHSAMAMLAEENPSAKYEVALGAMFVDAMVLARQPHTHGLPNETFAIQAGMQEPALGRATAGQNEVRWAAKVLMAVIEGLGE